MRINLIIYCVLVFAVSKTLCELDITPNSLIGTENLPFNLTDKQLAIQKYLAWLTILQDKSENNQTTNFGWKGWESNYNNDQKYLPAVRYPLAFIGYSIAALVYKTPAYKELSSAILDNVIQRMLESNQYKYIESYWKKTRYFPDPVIHENIMYSGHLAMLIALYESISGDFKYTEKGWYFKWDNQSIHYDTNRLMAVILNQVESDESGGVACEPNSIFVICNNHHRIAYVLHDAIHSTNFSSSNAKWEHWLIKHGRAPDIWPNRDYRYFRIIYYKPAHLWIPIYGTSGNDAWALAFMNTWISDKQLAFDGYQQMLKSKEWEKVNEDQQYLNAGLFGRISQLNTWLASSLFLSVENQFLNGRSQKGSDVLNWFEKNFAGFYKENSYTYKINDTQYQIWTTANLLLSMVTDKETFDEMYNFPFYVKHFNEPELINVDYPNLHVKYAFYNRTVNSLGFGLITDGKVDVSNASFNVANVVSFKNATLEYKNNTFDITKSISLNIQNRLMIFSDLVIKHDGLNEFTIYF